MHVLKVIPPSPGCSWLSCQWSMPSGVCLMQNSSLWAIHCLLSSIALVLILDFTKVFVSDLHCPWPLSSRRQCL